MTTSVWTKEERLQQQLSLLESRAEEAIAVEEASISEQELGAFGQACSAMELPF